MADQFPLDSYLESLRIEYNVPFEHKAKFIEKMQHLLKLQRVKCRNAYVEAHAEACSNLDDAIEFAELEWVTVTYKTPCPFCNDEHFTDPRNCYYCNCTGYVDESPESAKAAYNERVSDHYSFIAREEKALRDDRFNGDPVG